MTRSTLTKGAKDKANPLGEVRARHLIRWYNRGAGGRIRWGQSGDFDSCVRIAGKHMTPEQSRGFCAERHRDATGFNPGQAPGERRHKAEVPAAVVEADDSGRLVVTKMAPLRLSVVEGPGLLVEHEDGSILLDGKEAAEDVRRMVTSDLSDDDGGAYRSGSLAVEPRKVGDQWAYEVNVEGRRIVWAPTATIFPSWMAGADLVFMDGGPSTPAEFKGRLVTLDDEDAPDRFLLRRQSLARSPLRKRLTDLLTKHGSPDDKGYRTKHPNSRIGRAGMRSVTDDDRSWLKSQGITLPPAWSDVQVSENREAPLLAIGRDKKGRAQYVYSSQHSERQAAAKFERVSALSKSIARLDERLKADVESDPSAASVALMRYLGMRPGSDVDTGAEKKAFGATNLRVSHVSIDNGVARFRFVGKKGVDLDLSSDHPVVLAAVQAHMADKKPDDPLFGVSPARASRYLGDVLPGFKLKDLRTHIGTGLAANLVRSSEPPKSDKERRSRMREIAKRVSEVLGNTPAVALTSYIDPAVFSPWRMA